MTTILKFHADWCGPCKAMAPLVADIVKDYSDIELVSINVDEDPEIAAEYKIRSIPALVMIENGSVINTLIGNRGVEMIKEFFKSAPHSEIS